MAVTITPIHPYGQRTAVWFCPAFKRDQIAHGVNGQLVTVVLELGLDKGADLFFPAPMEQGCLSSAVANLSYR